MPDADLILISGSPSVASRSSRVLRAVGERCAAAGLITRHFSAQEFSAEDLLLARFAAPEVAAFTASVQGARGIVFSTPVYKAVYSGLLKVLVDLIPQDALRGKVALGIATAKLDGHASSVGSAYRELFGFFEVRVALPTLFLLDAQLEVSGDKLAIGPEAAQRIDASADALLSAVRAAV
jgi:FMN reductase